MEEERGQHLTAVIGRHPPIYTLLPADRPGRKSILRWLGVSLPRPGPRPEAGARGPERQHQGRKSVSWLCPCGASLSLFAPGVLRASPVECVQVSKGCGPEHKQCLPSCTSTQKTTGGILPVARKSDGHPSPCGQTQECQVPEAACSWGAGGTSITGRLEGTSAVRTKWTSLHTPFLGEWHLSRELRCPRLS